MLKILPLIHILGFSPGVNLKFIRNWKIRKHNIPFQLKVFNFIYNLIGIVKRFRKVMKKLTHFCLALEKELIIRKSKTKAFASFFIGGNRCALHIAGVHT